MISKRRSTHNAESCRMAKNKLRYKRRCFLLRAPVFVLATELGLSLNVIMYTRDAPFFINADQHISARYSKNVKFNVGQSGPRQLRSSTTNTALVTSRVYRPSTAPVREARLLCLRTAVQVSKTRFLPIP